MCFGWRIIQNYSSLDFGNVKGWSINNPIIVEDEGNKTQKLSLHHFIMEYEELLVVLIQTFDNNTFWVL